MSLSLPSNASRIVKSPRFSVTLPLWATSSKLRDALGSYFLWPQLATAPLLIEPGSGVVPLMAMIRYRRAPGLTVPTALLLSFRAQRDVLFGDELFSLGKSDSKLKLELAVARQTLQRASDFTRCWSESAGVGQDRWTHSLCPRTWLSSSEIV